MRTNRRKAIRTRPRTQLEVLRDVLLSARQTNTWLTIQELEMLTHYPAQCISAQLRHLRKVKFGSHEVRKRQREVDAVVRRELGGVVWEYQLGDR